MFKESALPRRLFHFYRNTDFAIQTVAFKQITFIHTALLNDPFDPYLTLETNFGERYSALLDYVSDKHPHEFERFLDRFDIDHWTRSNAEMRRYFHELKSRTFVFSTFRGDAVPSDLYMWGHYGDGHRGIAIEFDPNQLERDVANLDDGDRLYTGTDTWIEMNYTNQVPVISPDLIVDFYRKTIGGADGEPIIKRYFIQLLRVKSLAWSAENEWRLLWGNDETALKIQHASISAESIKGFYLGLNCSGSAQEALLFESKKHFPDAGIFKARKKASALAIEFDRLR